jgi:hypothetical protein
VGKGWRRRRHRVGHLIAHDPSLPAHPNSSADTTAPARTATSGLPASASVASNRS